MNADKKTRYLCLYLRVSACICGSILFGCAPKTPPKREPYFGPTLPMSEVVKRINENNHKVSSLWARQDLEATFKDDKGKWHHESMDGTLLYRPGRDLRLVAGKAAVGTVFELGSNQTVYWMSVRVDADTTWWGRYKNLGKDCSQPIPIRPDLVLEVLGVAEIPGNFRQQPVPTMRFNNDADAYMFTFNARLPDRWIPVKEVWYDRATLRPELVLLFDANGRVVLSAQLTNHRKVKDATAPEDKWPTVAADLRLYFPDEGAKLSLHLGDLALVHAGAPNDRTFQFEPQRAGTSKVVQLDEGCGP
jgi:hypothetical protein